MMTGGTLGIRDIAILDSAVHRPQATFGGIDLYSELADKAAHDIVSWIERNTEELK